MKYVLAIIVALVLGTALISLLKYFTDEFGTWALVSLLVILWSYDWIDRFLIK